MVSATGTMKIISLAGEGGKHIVRERREEEVKGCLYEDWKKLIPYLECELPA